MQKDLVSRMVRGEIPPEEVAALGLRKANSTQGREPQIKVTVVHSDDTSRASLHCPQHGWQEFSRSRIPASATAAWKEQIIRQHEVDENHILYLR